MTGNILLSGIVGSQAHGLATATSDIDTLGVYACDTRELHGLKAPDETRVIHSPDAAFHEAGKYCRLALKCNPTVLELLWLMEYQTKTQLGADLVGMRSCFLSARYVRDAYLGYASQQLRLLESRSGRLLGADPERRKRNEKHARHLRRLIYQGTGLYGAGYLMIKVNNPAAYHEFGQRVAAGDLDLARKELAWAEKFFDEVKPAVPDHPNADTVEKWLQRVRREYWRRS